jgi:hypothetical protein
MRAGGRGSNVEGMRARRALLTFAAALASLLVGDRARAQEGAVLPIPKSDPGVVEVAPAPPPPSTDDASSGPIAYGPQPPTLRGNARLDAHVAWFPRLPSLRMTFPAEFEGTKYEGVTAKLPSPGGGQFFVVGGEMGISLSRNWTLPTVGFSFGGAVGGYHATNTAFEGVPFTIEPKSAGYVYMQAIGLEYRARARRWMVEAGVRFGVSIAWMKTRYAIGPDAYETSGFAVSPALKGDVAICRRLDPEQRLCGFVSPAIYEFGALNGASFGLRWELGS